MRNGHVAGLQHRSQYFVRIKILLCNSPRRAAMALIVLADCFDCVYDVVRCLECEEALAARKNVTEAGVLDNDGLARSKVGDRAITKPTTARLDVRFLGHAEFSTRLA